MLTRIRPKHVMAFAILAMLCGIGIYALWNHIRMPNAVRHWVIMKWVRKDLGRYWVSGFYFFAGLVIFLRGYFGMRAEERGQKP